MLQIRLLALALTLMSVRVCVCMCARVCACVRLRVRLRVCACPSACPSARVCVFYVWLCVCAGPGALDQTAVRETTVRAWMCVRERAARERVRV